MKNKELPAKKLAVTVFVFILFTGSVLGISKQEPADSARILNEKAWEIKYQQPEKCLELATEAMKLAKKSEDLVQEAFALRNLSAYYLLISQYDEAEKYAHQAIEAARKSENLYEEAKSKNLLGIAYRFTGRHSKSVDYTKQSLEIFKTIKDTTEILGILNNLALSYSRIDDHEKAVDIHFEVFELEKLRGNETGIARSANNLGHTYNFELNKPEEGLKYALIGLKYSKLINNPNYMASAFFIASQSHRRLMQYDSCLYYLNKAEALNRKTGNKHWEANVMKEKALIYSFDSLKNTDSSLFYNREAFKLFSEIGNADYAVISMLDMADNLFELNQIDSTMAMIEKAKLLKDSLDIQDQLKISMLMSKIYENNSQWKEAQLETKKQITLSELLRDQEKSEMIESLKIKYDIRSKDIENQALRRENSINDKLLRKHFWLSLSLALLAGLMVVLVALLLKKRKADKIMNQKLAELNAKLLQKSEELSRSNASKDKLFSIIAHDLRSPFQNLLGLSEILHEEMEGDPRREYTALINNSAQKAFHLLDDLLIWGRNQIESQNASISEIDLEPLLSEVILEQEPQWRNKMLEIKTGLMSQMRCPADANIIKTVVRNIINNAIKFSPKGGEILIEAEKSDSYCSLNIIDFGIGMTEEQLNKLRKKEALISTEGTEKEMGNGLGLSLCFDLIEKINGEIRIESKKGKGSTFSVVIPLPS